MTAYRVFLVFFFRELRVALLNRMILIFGGLGLLAGAIPVLSDSGPDRHATMLYAVLQASLWLIPLFAILTGIGAAQNEQEEQAFLMSQPVGRGLRVLGKFAALGLIIAVAAGLLILPALLSGGGIAALAFLWIHTVAVGAVFAALGLAVGFSSVDRVKSHLLGLCLWLVLLIGLNLLALAAAGITELQHWPQVWLLLLMLNPLDVLRLNALFTLDQIPFDTESFTPLARWWLDNLSFWFSVLCLGWICAALAWSRNRLERME